MMRWRPLCWTAAIVFLGCHSAPEEFADTHKCDEFAAHPDDAGKWAEGVAEEDLLPGPAVKHCMDAVDRYPGTARFHFQLGRALWSAGRIDEGVEAFLAASEMEYAPSYAYLGDAYQEGLVPGEDADPEFARELYTLAADGGFEPAVAMLDGDFSDQPVDEPGDGGGRTTVAERKGPSLVLANPDYFKHPDWLTTLHDGDFATLLQVEGINLYLEGIQEFMKEENYRMIDPACSAVADIRLGPRLAAIRLGVGLDSSSEDAILGSGTLLLNTLTAFMNDPMGYQRFQAGMAYLMADGERDISTLVLAFEEEGGCVSPQVRTTYGNIGKFLDYSTEVPATRDGETGFQDMVAPPGSQGVDLKASYEASQRQREEERRAAWEAAANSAPPARRSSPPPPARRQRGVTLFAGENYGGYSEKFTSDDSDLSNNTIGDDAVSSVKVDQGCSAVLFARPGFDGRSVDVAADTPSLKLGWKQRLRQLHRAGNDAVSSVRVVCK